MGIYLKLINRKGNTKKVFNKANNKANNNANNKGFSLIEVLLAIVILSIITLPILSSFASAAKLNSNARKQENANAIAQKIIEQCKSLSITQLTDGNVAEGSYDAINNRATGVASCEVKQASNAKDKINQLIYNFKIASFDGTLPPAPPAPKTYLGEPYYDGPNGEKFFVEVTLDPTAYADKAAPADVLKDNTANNINSYEMPAFDDVNIDRNYVIMKDIYIYDTGIVTAFKTQKGVVINAADIKRAVTVTASIEALPDRELLKNSTGALEWITVYKQKLSVQVDYIDKNNSANVVSYTNDYLDNERAIENAEEINKANLLTVNKYNEIKTIYIFYNAFDKYRSGSYYSADMINIKYDYKNDLTLKDKLDVYLIQQDVENVSEDGNVYLDRRNVKVNVNNNDVALLSEGTLNLDGYTNDTGKVNIYSNITDWNSFIVNQKNGITQNTTPSDTKYLYSITVKIWVGEKKGTQYMTMTSTKEN